MFYTMEQLYDNFIAQVNAEYGTPNENMVKYFGNKEKEKEVSKQRQKHFKDFNKMMLSNSNFIINNRDKILQRIDEVYNDISGIVAEKQKEKQKIINNEIIICECGAKSYRKNLTTHRKSKRHVAFIQQK